MNVPILSVGIACIIAAIVGGGMKALGAEIPIIESTRRQVILGAFGALLIFGVFYLDRLNSATAKAPVPTTDTTVVPEPKKPEVAAKQGDANVIPPKPAAATPPENASVQEKPRSTDTQTTRKLIPQSTKATLQQRKSVSSQTGEIPGSFADILTGECDAGELKKCVELGKHNLPEHPAKALAVSKKACDAGLYEACAQMGFIYKMNDPTVQDYAQARFFYKHSCDKGYMMGCVDLADFFKYGAYGVSRDYPQAAALEKRACDGGEPRGCDHLGEFYEKGWGVPVDISMARHFYQQACSSGFFYGCNDLNKIQDK